MISIKSEITISCYLIYINTCIFSSLNNIIVHKSYNRRHIDSPQIIYNNTFVFRCLQVLQNRREDQRKLHEKPFSHSLSVEAQLAMQSEMNPSEHIYQDESKDSSRSRLTFIPQITPRYLPSRTASHSSSSSGSSSDHGGPTKRYCLPPLVPIDDHSRSKKTSDNQELASDISGSSYLPGIEIDGETSPDLFEDDMFISEIARENSVLVPASFSSKPSHRDRHKTVHILSRADTKDQLHTRSTYRKRNSKTDSHFSRDDEVTESSFYSHRSKTASRNS